MIVILCPLSHIHFGSQMLSGCQVLSTHHTFQKGAHCRSYAIRLKEVADESLCTPLNKLHVYHEQKFPTDNVLRNKSSFK